jgi:squalene-hopene/tetraprenyl-beta-curcumene cyclase
MLVTSRLIRSRLALALLLPALAPAVLSSAVNPAAAGAAETAAIREAIAKGSAHLVNEVQAADGSFAGELGPAVTALGVTALVRSGTPADDPAVTKGIAHLLSFRQPDGGIHVVGSPVANYETCIALLALVACNADGRHTEAIKGAEAFVRGIQWKGRDADDLVGDDHVAGGAGYGSKSRPDLSNTQFLIEALRAAGASADDPAIQRALAFVSRTQNLPGPHNPLPVAAKNPDGGFYYTPYRDGESQAGSTPEGGLRSYASMTYAGLKSFIFAGLDRDDPRIKAAVDWLRKHYSFAENPGMGAAGIFYYFHTAAKALDALGDDTFTDAAGRDHDWRTELADAIIARQRPDGSWVNANDRWLEGEPALVTSYALLALSYCLPQGP